MSHQRVRPVRGVDHLLEQFRAADDRATKLEAELRAARDQRRAAVAGLRKLRLSYALIGTWVGKSKSRIQQLHAGNPPRRKRTTQEVAA